MPNIVAVQLDHINESQEDKAEAANAMWDALSSAALYGVRSLTGLALELYGGNIILVGAPTPTATQTITLSNNTTNYIYDLAGVFTKSTTAPTGWPGPITSPSGALALYQLPTVDGFVDIPNADVYVPSLGVPGIPGVAGDPGPPGVSLAEQRARWYAEIGSASTANSQTGLTITVSGLTATARSLATTPFRLTVPYTAYVLAVSTAGSSGNIISTRTWCWRGNAAGRGGFTYSFRFCLESSLSPATFRCFFGLYTTTIGNVEPDTLFDIVGVGSKAGDANLSMIHNDASGTATMVPLGSNFPARSTDNMYELTLTAAANGSTIDYLMHDCGTGNTASGTLSSNLPTNTTFFNWLSWINNGSTAASAAFGSAQVIASTRW